jgi:DUF1009 family protein
MTGALAMPGAGSACTLGIIAGGGFLPRQLIESCLRQGRHVYVVAVEGEADPGTVEGIPHIWLRLGALGEALEQFKKAGAEELVLAGKIGRPKITALRPDAAGAKLLTRLGLSVFGGDAAIFKTIIAFLEEQGFHVIGVDDLLQDLVAPEGPMGKVIPDKQAQSDIALGARVARSIGAFDVGQAVIVKNGLVLGIEAAEGTDAMIARCAQIKGEGKGGVLVKARKPVQEDRVDLPAIGLRTVELVHEAGFAGIAIEAKHSIVVGRREVIRAADALGLFVIGFSLAE